MPWWRIWTSGDMNFDLIRHVTLHTFADMLLDGLWQNVVLK